MSLARRFAFVAFFVAFAVFACAVPAFAHARLVEAFPDEGNEFSESPEQIQLRFSEPVEAVFDPIVVNREDGERVDLDNARLDPENPEVVAVDLESDLPMGRYEVVWRVTSEDGHPIEDNYEFVVNSSAEDDSPDDRAPVEQVSEGNSPVGLETGVFLGGALAVVAATVGFVVIRRN